MTITKLKLTKFDDKIREARKLNEKVLAEASITLDYDFAIHNVQLLTGEKGYYILFPKDKVGKGIIYPINNEARILFLNAIVQAYENK